MLKSHISLLCAMLLCALGFCACGDSDSFTIEGTVDGNATMNLRLVYYNNNTLVKGITASRDGKFEYKGSVSSPTMIEILDNDYRPIGRLYVTNGEHIECELTRLAPYKMKVKGSDTSERWAAFLNDNADRLTGSEGNAVIEQYVASHPDDIVSTLLMITSYNAAANAQRADSIMSMINTEVRLSSLTDGFNTLIQRLVASESTDTLSTIPALTRSDSLVEVDPRAKELSLIMLSDESKRKADYVETLRRLSVKSLRPRLQVVDISLDKDTLTWGRSINTDSATWRQLWVSGSIASPGIESLGVPSIPYFIVTDSTGTQMLRTDQINVAEAFIDSCLNIKH